MTNKLITYQEIEERVDLYRAAYNNYEIKKSRLIRFLLDLGYKFYDNIYDYEGGVLLSPQLLESEDWKNYAHFDDEDEVWHINELTSLPITNWNADYHIIEL